MTDLAAAPSSDPALLARLVRLSRAVRTLIALGAIGLVGVQTWAWSSPERAYTLLSHSTVPVKHVSGQALWMGALCSVVPVLVVLLALRRLWDLFGEYRQGRVFSRRALESLRGAARWLLADAVVSPVYGALLSVVVSWDEGPGRRQLNIDVGSEDYTALLMGLILLAIASVMAEAVRVAEDHAGFV